MVTLSQPEEIDCLDVRFHLILANMQPTGSMDLKYIEKDYGQ